MKSRDAMTAEERWAAAARAVELWQDPKTMYRLLRFDEHASLAMGDVWASLDGRSVQTVCYTDGLHSERVYRPDPNQSEDVAAYLRDVPISNQEESG